MPFRVLAPETSTTIIPPATFVDWSGWHLTWTGWDGSIWDLTNPDSQVLLVNDGPIRGLSRPPFRRFTSSSPAVAGSRWRGYNTDEREVFLTILVWSDEGSIAFAEVDAAFNRTLRPDLPGTLALIAPDGTTRTLRCRYLDEDDGLVRDPTAYGWHVYGVRFIADDQPYWQGARIVRGFRQSADVPFFSNPGDGFVVNISPGETIDTAAIDNPGDVPAYLTHRVHGPTTAVTVRGTSFPFVIADGKAIILETSPAGQAALEADVTTDGAGGLIYTLTGVDKSGSLGSVDFSPLQPGEKVLVPMSMTGTGRVVTELTPSYFRALG